MLLIYRLKWNQNADEPWLSQLDWRIFTVLLGYWGDADVLWRYGSLWDKNTTSNNERLPGKLCKKPRNSSVWRSHHFSRQKSLLMLNSSKSFLFQSEEKVRISENLRWTTRACPNLFVQSKCRASIREYCDDVAEQYELEFCCLVVPPTVLNCTLDVLKSLLEGTFVIVTFLRKLM